MASLAAVPVYVVIEHRPDRAPTVIDRVKGAELARALGREDDGPRFRYPRTAAVEWVDPPARAS